MAQTGALKSRLDAAAAGLRRAIESNAEAERLAARHLDLPGVAPQLLAVRAAAAAAVSADTAAQRAHAALEALSAHVDPPVEEALTLAFSSAAEAVGQAADAAAQGLGVLTGLVNQRTRFERRSGRR